MGTFLDTKKDGISWLLKSIIYLVNHICQVGPRRQKHTCWDLTRSHPRASSKLPKACYCLYKRTFHCLDVEIWFLVYIYIHNCSSSFIDHLRPPLVDFPLLPTIFTYNDALNIFKKDTMVFISWILVVFVKRIFGLSMQKEFNK